MDDCEKVIKGFAAHLGSKIPQCKECPYFNFVDMRRYNDPNSCLLSMMTDALALLKEQEPVEVDYKNVDDGYQAIKDDFTCKHCGAWWMIPRDDLKYCPGCGRKVRWDA